MSSISGHPNLDTLDAFYKQAEPLLSQKPENLSIKFTEGSLALEKRTIVSWFYRVICRRADTEYNFVGNLEKFQKLKSGNLFFCI